MLILVCLDTSPLAAHVLRNAADLARMSRAKLCLLRVVEGAGELPEANETLLAQAKIDLSVLAADVPKDLIAGFRVGMRTVWRTICETAREEGADLIVVGARKHGRFQRIVGSTAARVVNRADCAVLVVRPRRLSEVRRRPKKTRGEGYRQEVAPEARAYTGPSWI